MAISIPSKFTRRDKLMIIFGTGFLALALIYFLAVDPALERWVNLNRQIKTKQSTLAKNFKILSEQEIVRTEYLRLSKFAKSSSVKDEDVTASLDELEHIARENSVTIASIKPQGNREFGLSREIILDVSLEAPIKELSRFIYSLENTNRLLRVRKLTISSSSSNVLKCSVLLSKFLMSRSNE